MNETPAEKPLRIFLAVLVCNILFAAMNVFVKLASEHHSVMEIIFFRNAFGLLPVLLVLLYTGGPALLRTKRPIGHFMRSFVGNISMIFYFLSFSLLPLANAISIQSASPLILTVLSIPLLGEKVGPHRLGAVAVGLCAVLFMLQPAGAGNITGSVSALAAAIMAAFAMVIIRKLGRTEHHLTIVFYFSAFGALMSGLLLPFGFWSTPTLLSFIYLLMAGLFGGGGQIFLTYAYAKAPAAFVSAFSYVSIVFGAICDWLIWQHAADWRIAAGSAVIIASGLYILHRETLKKKVQTPEAVTLNE